MGRKFLGEISQRPKILLFTAKITSRSKEKELDVFLASNTAEEVCDFKVKASSRGGSCVIYAGGSSIHNCCRGKIVSAQTRFLFPSLVLYFFLFLAQKRKSRVNCIYTPFYLIITEVDVEHL
ncbi:hypothetical protein L1049_008118 [Liquidambar formosana]|uniref:Uncharacterized protein n=1 Tax=Liquidambar formosana TaxID=63359 RepID=A0AAP0S2J2_LIQFO